MTSQDTNVRPVQIIGLNSDGEAQREYEALQGAVCLIFDHNDNFVEDTLYTCETNAQGVVVSVKRWG